MSAPRARAARGGRGARAGRALAAALALLAGGAPAARAQAPGDSLLHAYVRAMADSTDRYFGLTAQPTDTTGLDSALARGLAMLRAGREPAPRRRLGLGVGPSLGFNRVDGGQLGAAAGLRAGPLGRLSGAFRWTTGGRDAIGEARLERHRRERRLDASWSLALRAGRWTEALDRDDFDATWATMLALLDGSDRTQYLRRDGWNAALRLQVARFDGGLGWRDVLESPRTTTTRWNLLGAHLAVPGNAPAAFGRARELRFTGSWRMSPFQLDAEHATSDPRLGSAFRYRRSRAALGGDLGLGGHLVVALEAAYGRLRGEALPQQAFFLGGTPSLEAFDRDALQGSGRTFGRADLLLLDDVLALARVPHPAAFPLQLGAFAASGAVWGRDPLTGLAAPTARDAPRRNEWRSEAGVSLLYRPGLPDPQAYLRLDRVQPLGRGGGATAWALSFQRTLHLLDER